MPIKKLIERATSEDLLDADESLNKAVVQDMLREPSGFVPHRRVLLAHRS